jgi:hypothetical protein
VRHFVKREMAPTLNPYSVFGSNQLDAGRKRINHMEALKSMIIGCINLLMGHPVLALVPSLGFFVLALNTRRLTVAFAAIGWTLYAVYEEAMRLHVFCARGCNIRLDLVLIYPVLIALSIAGLVVGLRARRSAQPRLH